LQIPNSIEQPSIQSNALTSIGELDLFISKMEYVLLVNALGYVQYSELISQFNPDGTLINSPIQKWADLTNGKTLPDGRRWSGLRFEVGNNKISLIAYYVFYNFKLHDETTYTTVGEVKPEAENAISVSPVAVLTARWNEFISMYQGRNLDIHPYIWNNFYYNWGESCHKNISNISLLDYLLAYPEDYDVKFFTTYETKNIWGI